MPIVPEVLPPVDVGLNETEVVEVIEETPGPTTRAKVEGVLNSKPSESTANNTFLGHLSSEVIAAKGEGNVAVGEKALVSDTTGSANVAIGQGAAEALTTGTSNVAVGKLALQAMKEEAGNVVIGAEAGKITEAATSSVLIGIKAGAEITTGDKNVVIGAQSGLKAGTKNVTLGFEAGKEATSAENVVIGAEAGTGITGKGNIIIGYQAAATDPGEQKLYIHNGGTTTPLIKGNMKAGELELQFNAEKMGFFKHAPEVAPKLTGNKVTEISVVLKTICEALAKLGLAKDETV